MHRESKEYTSRVLRGVSGVASVVSIILLQLIQCRPRVRGRLGGCTAGRCCCCCCGSGRSLLTRRRLWLLMVVLVLQLLLKLRVRHVRLQNGHWLLRLREERLGMSLLEPHLLVLHELLLLPRILHLHLH